MASSLPSEEIEKCKEKIEKEKPKKASVGDLVDGILAPSAKKDWQKIRFFERMSNTIRKTFREKGKVEIPDKSFTLTKAGRDSNDKGVWQGSEWDTKLSIAVQRRKVKKEKSTSKEPTSKESNESPEDLMLEKISEHFDIDLLESEFTLYGFMHSKKEEIPKVFYWKGKADAIGWHKKNERYVIVEWKVVGDIATFWEKDPDAYGKFLHQCLVYARLLQLHLTLDYLPHILIVPISKETGKDFHPVLFYEYPEECKEVIKDFEWCLTFSRPPVKFELKKPFNTEKLKKGEEVNKKMLLADFFAKDATVEELLEVCDWPSLKLI